ncbi:SymE family type I addiction module toxin [Cupriavidus taiwanensis]|uniref:SymE family type I addiction module toxin n=1 Tax=Cupriavidus taiwanensis TaxID=164546 RepID=UPI001EFFA14F|nr:SymE family type I addiction module toxin [Cupriavidus taiwanensis]
MKKISIREHVRTIKIGRTYFPVIPAKSNNFTGIKLIPWIRLSGVWLVEAGFHIGQQLEVHVQQGRIVIHVH